MGETGEEEEYQSRNKLVAEARFPYFESIVVHLLTIDTQQRALALLSLELLIYHIKSPAEKSPE